MALNKECLDRLELEFDQQHDCKILPLQHLELICLAKLGLQYDALAEKLQAKEAELQRAINQGYEWSSKELAQRDALLEKALDALTTVLHQPFQGSWDARPSLYKTLWPKLKERRSGE